MSPHVMYFFFMSQFNSSSDIEATERQIKCVNGTKALDEWKLVRDENLFTTYHDLASV